MIGVAVGFKALCDSVPDLQQARASVLQLLLVRQTLVGLVQLLQGLLHWPHALLALRMTLMEQSLLLRQPFDFSGFILNGTKKGETHNAEGLLVEFVVLFPLDGDGLRSSCDVDWTLSLLPFGCFSLTDKKKKKKKKDTFHTTGTQNTLDKRMVGRWPEARMSSRSAAILRKTKSSSE